MDIGKKEKPKSGMSMESKEKRTDRLTCRLVQEGETVRANIGTDRLLAVETETDLAAVAKSRLFSTPLMPYRNAFESQVYAAYDQWAGWRSELEKKRKEQETIRLTVEMKLQKELLLVSDRYPDVKFRLEHKDCVEGSFQRWQKGDEVEAQIVSVQVAKRLVNVTARFEQVSLDDLKKMINRKVCVAVNGYHPRMGVFVDFKGYAGLVGYNGLHYREADMADHYKALIGKTMNVYLFKIDEVSGRLFFSENSLWRKKEGELEGKVAMQPGEAVEGFPTGFHPDFGVYVCCRGITCLVKRDAIPNEVWNTLPERYTLGENYLFRVRQILADPRRIYLSLPEETDAQPDRLQPQPLRLTREVDAGLPLGVDGVAIPYSVGVYGLLLQYENYLGMLTFHQAPQCISFFRKEILAKKLPFRIRVEEYEGKYSFAIRPYMSQVMAELGEVGTLRMRIEAIAGGGELLLSYRNIYAGLFFKEAVWKKTSAPLPRFEEGQEIEVAVCKSSDTPYDLAVSLVPTLYNPWMASSVEAARVVQAEIIEMKDDETVLLSCDGLYGTLEPRFRIPGYTYAVADVLQVLVVAIDRAGGRLWLAHNRSCFVDASVQDLTMGEECLINVTERIFQDIALAELDGKYALVRFQSLSELAALVLFRTKPSSIPLQARVASVSEWGTLLFEADGRWLNGIDYNKFVKGKVMDCLVSEIVPDGYVLDCHGVAGLLPFAEMEKLLSQMTSYAVGDRITAAFLGTGTVQYPLLFSTKLLTEEQWKALEVEVGQEVEVKVAGITTCVVVSYRGVLGTIPPLDLSLKKRYVLAEEVAVGDMLRVEVLKVNIRKRQLMFSRRNILLKMWAAADLSIGKNAKVQVKKRGVGAVEVEYGGLPGVIDKEYLSWSHPSLALKLYLPGSRWDACIVAVDEEAYCIHFNAKLLQDSPWPGFPYLPGDIVKAEIKQFTATEMLLDIRGILTSLSKACVCWMAGKQELVPLESLPWKAGDSVEVKIVRLSREESIVEVEPVAPPIVYKPGDTCRMQIKAVYPNSLQMRTYLGETYLLPLAETSWFALSDLRGVFTNGQELTVTVQPENKEVSLKPALPDPWESFCYGHQFRAALTLVLPASLVFVWKGNRIQLSTPEALHIPAEYLARIDLRHLFTEGEEFELRVVSFRPDEQEMQVGIVSPRRVSPIAQYQVRAALEGEMLVRGKEGWGIVPDAGAFTVGTQAWLALERREENGFLHLTSALQGHAVELCGHVISCLPVALQPDYLECRAEAYPYLSVRLPWEEWSWTNRPEERPEWQDIADVPVSLRVMRAAADELTVYASRKALMEDPRGLEDLQVGDVCALTVERATAKTLEVAGNGYTSVVPAEDWNWHRLDGCAHLFQAGDRIRAKITSLNREEGIVSFSLKALAPDPWASVEALWAVGEILDFTVCRVTERHLFLQRQGLIVPVPAAGAYWQAGHQFLFDYEIGQVVQAKLTGIDLSGHTLSLSIRELYVNPLEAKSLPRPGEIVEGFVSRINNRHVFVDCGEWIVRVMPDDLVWGILQEQIEPYKVGERVRCLVQQISLDRASIKGSIRDLLPQPERQFPLGEICMTSIYQFAPQGILLNYEGYKGFIPFDDIPFAIDEIKDIYEGRTQLWAYLKEVDFKHHKLIFSLEDIKEVISAGACGKAQVVAVKPEGVEVLFHRIPVRIPGEELDWRPLEDTSAYFREGDEVPVRIVRLQAYYNELALSIKQTIPDPWLTVSLAVGETIETTVHHTSLKMIYFAYKNLWGKIPYKEALWQTGYKLADYYVKGQPIRCRVTEFDPANYLLKASMIALQEDPFDRLPFGKYEKVEVTVANVGSQGLKVAVGEWLGYLPYEEFAWFKLEDPAALYAEGDRLTAVCKEIDRQAHTLFFSLRLLARPGGVEEVTVKEVHSEGIQVAYNHLPVFIPNEELSWSRLEDAAILFREQDKVKVLWVADTEKDPDAEIAFPSVKRVTADPWESAGLRPGDVAEGKVVYRDKKNLYVVSRGLLGKIAYRELFWQEGHLIADHYDIDAAVVFRVTELDMPGRLWKGSVNALQQDILQCMPFGEGDRVRVVVDQVGSEGFRVKTGLYLGYLPFEELDWEILPHPQAHYKKGDEVEAVCKKIDATLRTILFSVRMLLPDPMRGLLPGCRVKARITEVRETCLAACIDELIRAVIPKEETSWKYQAGHPYPVPLQSLFSIGREVEAVVTAVDRGEKEVALSIKALRPDPCLSCREGDVVDLTVLEVMKKGELLVEWEEYIGSMMKYHAFYQKDIRLLYQPGEKLQGKILKVNPVDRRVFITAKYLYEDPFTNLSFQPGDTVSARIVEKREEALLVELENRIRCLIPFIEAGYRYEEIENGFRTGGRIEARVTQIDTEAKWVDLSVKALRQPPAERQSLVGTDREAVILSEDADGILASVDGWLGYVPAAETGYKERMPFEQRTRLDKGRPYPARVAGIDEKGTLCLSLKALQENPYRKYRLITRQQIVQGRVFMVHKAGFSVELEDAPAYISRKNLTWKPLEDWQTFFEIGGLYPFKILHVEEENITLTCLEDLPFDEKGEAAGVVVRKDEKKVYIEVSGIEMFVSQKDTSLDVFNTALGGRDIRPGARVIVRCKKVDYREHFIQVSVVSAL